MPEDNIVKAVLEDTVVQAAIAHEADSGERRGIHRSVTSGSGLVAPPTVTEEEERVSAGQREINLIWESTQMKVALSVIWSSLIVSSGLAVFGKFLGTPDIQLAAVVFLFGVANLVSGFYFGRTNHEKQGGVGKKEMSR